MSKILAEKLILAIETSCDDTAIAIMAMSGKILTEKRISQTSIHKPFGGIVPHLAAHGHRRCLAALLNDTEVLRFLDFRLLDCVATTCGPGIGACLSAGFDVGRVLSGIAQVPHLMLNHLEGHLLSPQICKDVIKFPAIFLLLSGGNTQIILASKLGQYHILGQTLDDAVGEALDKCCRLISTEWASSGSMGPTLEKLARTGQIIDEFNPTSRLLNPLDFSFSGLKTAFQTFIDAKKSSYRIGDLAATVQHRIFQHILDRVENACKLLAKNCINIDRMYLIGGVAANVELRRALEQTLRSHEMSLVAAELPYCVDNATMIAELARSIRLEKENRPCYGGVRPDWNVECLSNKPYHIL